MCEAKILRQHKDKGSSVKIKVLCEREYSVEIKVNCKYKIPRKYKSKSRALS